ncbi:hypothetical protein CKA55_08275 [Arcobacter suis]|uniref:Uncharacterized protein n=1 Tax=Arcobacter suis CECT 7833 TaxID=663365 RepID=A0AAD0WQT7_9BACT|nr:hypothetical protein [Arcobacter suis]AXX89818.1 hypothetical protein ASUIS_1336 [Arcobacter suis CECT 7833]RWS46460.1 hypothetical protein CKA55_08275 [Arcobacter suis]
MIILGDKNLPYENIFFVSSIEEIVNTKANSTLLFFYNLELLKYSYENELSSAVIVTSIKDAIYSNNLNAKYIISENDLATQIQKIADNYMYDSKNLVIINSNEEFEQTAKAQIDGAIFKELINQK